MAVILGIFSINHRIVSVDSDRPVIMRDGKGKNFSVKLHFTINESEEIYSSSYRKGHAISILSVCDIERCGAALHLACEKREVHVKRSHGERFVAGDEVANEGSKLVELGCCKGFAFESHRIVRLGRLNPTEELVWGRVPSRGIELFQPSLILSIRMLRGLAPKIVRVSAEGTINRVIS